MKRTVSPQAKQKLYPILRWLLNQSDMNHGMPTMRDVDITVEQICEWYEAQNTFSDGIHQEREEETDDPEFKGVAYEKDIDQEALKRGFYKVFEFMAGHPEEWFLDVEIADATGIYVPSVQRYRSYMRQPEFGTHIVNRRRRAGMRIWEYTLIPNDQSKIYQHFQLSQI